MRSERVLRQAQPPDRAVVRRRPERHCHRRQPQRISTDIQPVVAMDRRDEIAERLQVHGPDHRDANRRMYRRHEDGKIRFVSEAVMFAK